MTSKYAVSEVQPLLSPNVDDRVELAIPSADRDDSQASLNTSWSTTIKVIGVMYCWFYCGITVTAIGALFEHFKHYYGINNSKASLIFSSAIFGYLIAALSLPVVARRGGWRGVATISPLCHVIATALLSIGPPFPVALVAYFFGGAGYGLCDAGFNAWASQQKRANVVQGCVHSAFAVGAVLGPLATLAATENGLEWYVFYRGVLLLAVFETCILSYAYREDLPLVDDVSKCTAEQQPPSNLKAIKLAAYCCVFYFVYMAIESSFNNFIVSYMSAIRHLSQTRAAFSSSIFWVGMAVGRVGLGPVSERFGTGIAVSGYIFVAICLQVVFRLTDNETVSFALLATTGIFLGPMFPSAVILMSRKLSQPEVLVAVSVAISLGQGGASFAPMPIAFMADKYGLGHLPDVILCLLALLLLVWMTFAWISR